MYLLAKTEVIMILLISLHKYYWFQGWQVHCIFVVEGAHQQTSFMDCIAIQLACTNGDIGSDIGTFCIA